MIKAPKYLLLLFCINLFATEKRLTELKDLFEFRFPLNAVVSENGQWFAYEASPRIGNSEGMVAHTDGKAHWNVPRGSNPVISKDGSWVLFTQKPDATELEKAGENKKKKEKLKNGLILLRTSDGHQHEVARVKSAAISGDNQWVAWLHFKDEEKKEDKEDKPKADDEDKPKEDKTLGTRLVLRRLDSGDEIEIEGVTHFAFSNTGGELAYALSNKEGKGNGVFYRALKENPNEQKVILEAEATLGAQLEWDRTGARLAFTTIPKPDLEEDKKKKDKPDPVDGSIHVWSPGRDAVQLVFPEGWATIKSASLDWTHDGSRLFFGLKPIPAAPETKDEDEEEEVDLYDFDRILKKRDVDVWHAKDPRIKTRERILWPRLKNRTDRTVWHADSGKIVKLATEDFERVRVTQSPHYTLAATSRPYRWKATWHTDREDLAAININTGEVVPFAREWDGRFNLVSISHGGKFAAWQDGSELKLFDLQTRQERVLNADIKTPFVNEDHDYPNAAMGYGIAGWLEDDAAVLAYDKYDIWQFPTDGSEPFRLTKGRESGRAFRLLNTDPDRHFYKDGEQVMMRGESERDMSSGFYQAVIGKNTVITLYERSIRMNFEAKAKHADRIIFTSETYHEPEVWWSSNTSLEQIYKISEPNSQFDDVTYAKSELVHWNSTDGKPLKGVLIKPPNYDPAKSYPTIVYIYRILSDDLHNFDKPRISTYPAFQWFAAQGYVIFKPDVLFDIGNPGRSTIKCVNPGVQMLIDKGIADPKAIALHGHSWGGYQAAHAITQTDLFACSIAGAPVTNMTSAYSGIRLGSGMARQFQYEQSQSRIGASLWERRDLYIENSPVFFADRVNTPLLIMFGDKDNAVPWQQGIEYYLALRRLDKDVHFLQYRGERHGLGKNANRLDYQIKMKEYFDHYLKGEPPADWIKNGVPYEGK